MSDLFNEKASSVKIDENDERIRQLMARGDKLQIIQQILLVRHALNTLLQHAAHDHKMVIELGRSKHGIHLRIDGEEL